MRARPELPSAWDVYGVYQRFVGGHRVEEAGGQEDVDGLIYGQ